MSTYVPLPNAQSSELSAEIVANFDKYIRIQNSITGKLRTSTNNWDPLHKRVKTSEGVLVDFKELRHRLDTARYKLGYVSTSLAMMQRIEGDYRNRVVTHQDLYRQAASEDIRFFTDTFLTFLGSTLESLAWAIRLTYGINMKKRTVSFYKVAEYLSADTSLTVKKYKSLFRVSYKKLGTKSRSWLHKFVRYRDFVVHYGYLETDARAELSGTTERIFLFMIPDDPDARPPKYRKKIELVSYCQEVLPKLLRLIVMLLEFVDATLRGVKPVKPRLIRRTTATSYSATWR